MSDSVLDRLRESSSFGSRIRGETRERERNDREINGGQRETNGAAEPTQPADAAEDFGSFGWLRGIHDRAIMLELRKRDGNIVAIGYSWIERMEYDPSVGITLHAAGRTITLRGRNLNAEVREGVRMFEGLARHRVTWVMEYSGRYATNIAATNAVDAIEG